MYRYMASSSPLHFSVRRREPELVAPASPTPREMKQLSDIDIHAAFYCHIPLFNFYRHVPAMVGRDPAAVIRDSLARALVFYYPIAGRIRAGDGMKLFVDCTGEGVLFVEADADFCLEQFGDALPPPLPYLKELLYDVDVSSSVLHTPLLLIQVTRLQCGGFVVAFRGNHAMSDGAGAVQLMNAIGELARGAPAPTLLPVWRRELLEFPEAVPTRSSSADNDKYAEAPPRSIGTVIPLKNKLHRSFFFGPRQVASLRRHLPLELRRDLSTVEILIACLWRARILALQPTYPEETFTLIIPVNIRGRHGLPVSLPAGFYGNAFSCATAHATAGELCRQPLAYAAELVRRAKSRVLTEFARSMSDLMMMRDWPLNNTELMYIVSDITRACFEDVDYGWGKAVYGGPTIGGVRTVPGGVSYLVPFVNAMGEKEIVVQICLGEAAMERFAVEIQMLAGDQVREKEQQKAAIPSSAL